MFREEITTFALTQSVSDLALNFGEGDTTTKKKPMARPFGVAMLIAGIDKNGPELYSTGKPFVQGCCGSLNVLDPSGTMI